VQTTACHVHYLTHPRRGMNQICKKKWRVNVIREENITNTKFELAKGPMPKKMHDPLAGLGLVYNLLNNPISRKIERKTKRNIQLLFSTKVTQNLCKYDKFHVAKIVFFSELYRIVNFRS